MNGIDINSILSSEQRKAIIEGQISDWAYSLYRTTIVRDAVKDENPEAILAAENKIIADLTKAISYGKIKLALIDSEDEAVKEAEQAAAKMFAEQLKDDALADK